MSDSLTTLDAQPADPVEDEPRRPGRWRARLASIEMLAAVVALALLLRGSLVDLFSSPKLSTLLTVFVSVAVAGLPFLVLGAAASATLAAFLPPGRLDRLLALRRRSGSGGRRWWSALPAAAGIGVAAPLGDEATEVAAGVLRRSGMGGADAGARLAQAMSLTFLLSSVSVSPVVLVATVVAFPAEPLMVLARLLAGLLVALGLGALWLWFGRAEWLSGTVVEPEPVSDGRAGADPAPSGWPVFWERCRLDVVRAGGFLVLGAFAAAVLTVWVPGRWLDAIGGTGVLAVILMALLAVLLSVRGGVDAFVAAAVSQFPATARLAFLVVGPVANLRQFTRQVATFGPAFALRFAPAALGLGLLSAGLVGAVLL